MGFKILKKMHNAAGGKHHHDDCDYSSSSEDEESYDSFEDENYVVKDDQHKHADEDDERSKYSSSSDGGGDDDDETEIDPELLCPNCGAQTHEYVRKGTILKKWKRLPVEDDDVVDPQTGDCVACKNERLEKMKSEWLDDIPTLPEGLFKKRNNRKDAEDVGGTDGNGGEDDQVSGCAPIRTQGERYRNAIRNRHAKKASFGSTSTDNNEEESSLYDESTFSCGISINSDGRSIRTGRSKLDTLTEVPEREETSVEESENSSEEEEEEDGSEDTEEVEEELDEVEEEIGNQLAQLEKEVSAYRSGATKVDEPSRQTPSVSTGRFDDFLADHEASPFTENAKEKSAVKCDESIAGQNGANDDGNNEINPSVADVSNVLEQYTSAKDQLSTKQRMAEMGRTFRGMVAGGIGNKKKKSEVNREEEDSGRGGLNIAVRTTTPEDQSTPDWAAGLVKEKVDQPQMINTTEVNNSQHHDDGAMPVSDGEKDPQLFYNEAVAAVAAANASQADINNKTGDEVKKLKKMTFKPPFHRKLKPASAHDVGNVVSENTITRNDGVVQQPKPKESESFGFPDLLPEEGEKEKKSKKFGIKIGMSKKKHGESETPLAEENPFLPSNITPVQPTEEPKQQVTRKMISSMFPDNVLGGIPEDRPDDSPPPPVLEIATGPDEDDDDLANPNTTDVDHLIRGLQRTVDDPRLARKFLISLRTMSIHHPNRLGIAEAGGIHAIVVCMGRFKRESSVAKQGCAALQNLVCADKNEQRSVEEGALDAIVRAMMNHSRSPGTQEHGAAALRNLTAGSISNRSAVAEAGGIEALIRAMKIHNRSVDVQDKCCAALANICNKHRANRIAIGEAGGIPHVAQALKRHGYRNKSVAEKGIRCLLNLSHTSRNVEMMKWEEGIEGLVLGVAHRHGGKCKDWALKIFLKM